MHNATNSFGYILPFAEKNKLTDNRETNGFQLRPNIIRLIATGNREQCRI